MSKSNDSSSNNNNNNKLLPILVTTDTYQRHMQKAHTAISKATWQLTKVQHAQTHTTLLGNTRTLSSSSSSLVTARNIPKDLEFSAKIRVVWKPTNTSSTLPDLVSETNSLKHTTSTDDNNNDGHWELIMLDDQEDHKHDNNKNNNNSDIDDDDNKASRKDAMKVPQSHAAVVSAIGGGKLLYASSPLSMAQKHCQDALNDYVQACTLVQQLPMKL